MCSADFSRIIELSRLFKLQRERCVHLRIAVGFIWVIQRPTYSCSSYINCLHDRFATVELLCHVVGSDERCRQKEHTSTQGGEPGAKTR
uniref:Uncharacterized protein n=1 Tax=Aegilops tauschii subsp. strangulata TaxID=200361 RepID=A0A453IKL3_AEGTS